LGLFDVRASTPYAIVIVRYRCCEWPVLPKWLGSLCVGKSSDRLSHR
jgi:hypothetical protein